MGCSREYTSDPVSTVTYAVEIVCDPWYTVESIPTCPGTSLETVRVIYSHPETSHAPLMAARPLLLLLVGGISGEDENT